MSTPDGYVIEGPIDDGEWTDWELLSAHRDRATAEAWVDDWPHWREAGARIRPFRYTDAPASGEPSGAEAVVRAAHQERDADARRLAELVLRIRKEVRERGYLYVESADLYLDLDNAERLARAAMADTQTEGDDAE